MPCLSSTGKVFVTYESDSEDHVKEIIKFVALLRHNGFDTHVQYQFEFHSFHTHMYSMIPFHRDPSRHIIEIYVKSLFTCLFGWRLSSAD